MPEGHTIHRLARDIAKDLSGRNLLVTSPQGRATGTATAVNGRVLIKAEAYGKHLALHCQHDVTSALVDDTLANTNTAPVNTAPTSALVDDTLANTAPTDTNTAIIHVHLGLIGKFSRVLASTPARDTIRLRLAAAPRDPVSQGSVPQSSTPQDSVPQSSTPQDPVPQSSTPQDSTPQDLTPQDSTSADLIWDLTGPQTCEIINEGEWNEIITRLGPDPLRAGAGPKAKSCIAFCAALAATKVPLSAVLLNQSIVAGIGNVFRSELAFLIRVDPRRSANSLTGAQTQQLWQTTVKQMRFGVRLNRIVTLNTEDAQATAGTTPGRLDRSEALYVYKRHDEPCRRCGTNVKTEKLAGRSIWWCPRCQT